MISERSKVAAAQIERTFPGSHAYYEDLHSSSLEVQKLRRVGQIAGQGKP